VHAQLHPHPNSSPIGSTRDDVLFYVGEKISFPIADRTAGGPTHPNVARGQSFPTFPLKPTGADSEDLCGITSGQEPLNDTILHELVLQRGRLFIARFLVGLGRYLTWVYTPQRRHPQCLRIYGQIDIPAPEQARNGE
jgi:hypothetical protein